VAHLDAALVEEILDMPQRQREADVEHDGEADDLGRGLEVPERTALAYVGPLTRSSPGSSDSVTWGDLGSEEEHAE
jgi:hypothetical protein